MTHPHPAHQGQPMPLPAHQPGRPTQPARKRQVMVSTNHIGRCCFVVYEGLVSRNHYRPTAASIQRLGRLLKKVDATPQKFILDIDGPTLFFDVHGAVGGDVEPAAPTRRIPPPEVSTGQLVPCEECGQLYHDTDRWRPGRGFCPDCQQWHKQQESEARQ